jgi:hypothetical protein
MGPFAVSCANGTTSAGYAGLPIQISGESFNGSVSGSEDALVYLWASAIPTQPHSRVSLTVDWIWAPLDPNDPDPFSWETPGTYTYRVHWYGTDPGTVLRFHVWDMDSGGRLSITHVGPIDLHETHSLLFKHRMDMEVYGDVIATSTTPEPGTALLASVALIIACGYRRMASVVDSARR